MPNLETNLPPFHSCFHVGIIVNMPVFLFVMQGISQHERAFVFCMHLLTATHSYYVAFHIVWIAILILYIHTFVGVESDNIGVLLDILLPRYLCNHRHFDIAAVKGVWEL